MTVTIDVPGFKCPGKGSVRVFRGRAYKDASTATAMRTLSLAVKQAWGSCEPLSGPVAISIRRTVPPAQKARHDGDTWDTRKPDADNIAKLVLDCMSGVVFADDRQIARLLVTKIMGRPGSAPHLSITVRQLHRDDLGAEQDGQT